MLEHVIYQPEVDLLAECTAEYVEAAAATHTPAVTLLPPLRLTLLLLPCAC